MSKYFKLSEFLKSTTADAFQIVNMPSPEQVDNLEVLMLELDKIREEWGSPIIITSGYRCEALNKKVKGSATSHHRCLDGYAAADFKALNGRNKELLQLIRKMAAEGKIRFVQLINEYNYSWLHFSINIDDTKNKMQYLVIR